MTGLSPFATPMPGLRIKEGVPAILRPTTEEIASFPQEARQILDDTWRFQAPLVKDDIYDLKWVEGRHFLLAGATGSGLGGALAIALLHLLKSLGSLTVVARDLTRSLGYETGVAMKRFAQKAGFEDRFHWLNSGLALEGEDLQKIIHSLQAAGARRVVYINTVAAASSGLLPNCPPIFIRDVDEEGLFQWQLTPLSARSIEMTKFVMGALAVQFPLELEKSGIEVEATVFSDWRGSLDRISRDPNAIEYGRQGAYSTSLYLPKDIIHEATVAAYGSGKIVLDVFLPVMRTRALTYIPGGMFMSSVFAKLMRMEGIQRVGIPELALAMLDRIGRTLENGDSDPFPRLDSHEAPLDLWFHEVSKRINNDENSEFYFKRWVEDNADANKKAR